MSSKASLKSIAGLLLSMLGLMVLIFGITLYAKQAESSKAAREGWKLLEFTVAQSNLNGCVRGARKTRKCFYDIVLNLKPNDTGVLRVSINRYADGGRQNKFNFAAGSSEVFNMYFNPKLMKGDTVTIENNSSTSQEKLMIIPTEKNANPYIFSALGVLLTVWGGRWLWSSIKQIKAARSK